MTPEEKAQRAAKPMSVWVSSANRDSFIEGYLAGHKQGIDDAARLVETDCNLFHSNSNKCECDPEGIRNLGAKK